MKRTRLLLVGLLSAGLLAGCGDDGGPGRTVVLADLIGTWEASVMEFTSVANPALQVDLVDLGVDFWLTVGGDADYTVVMFIPFEGYETETGSASVVDGSVTILPDGEIGPITFAASLSGGTLTLTGEDEFDFDDDGTDEAAELRLVLSAVGGTTAADLEGVWEASEFRYISDPVPTDTFDIIDAGGSLTITMDDDGRYVVEILFPPDPLETVPGTLVIDGNQMYLIDDLGDPLDPMTFTFSLVGDTITLTGGEDEYDFDDDGTPESATLEAVLSLQ